MLRPVPMKKVRIYSLKHNVETLINKLYSLGALHISKTKLLSESKPLDKLEKISELLLKLRSIATILGINLTSTESFSSHSSFGGDVFLKAEKINKEELVSLKNKKEELEEELERLKDKQVLLFKLGPMDVDLDSLPKRIGFKIGELRSELPDGPFEVSGGEIKLIVYDRSKEAEVLSILDRSGFKPVSIEVKNPKKDLEEISNEIFLKTKELENINSKLELKKEQLSYLPNLVAKLESEAEKAKVTSLFGSSDHFFLIEGWVPEEKVSDLKKTVSKTKSHIEVLDVSHEDHPPVLLKNKGPTKPFQFITETYTFPNYHEFDPTFFYFFSLPIIFGLIVGDFVYGVISLLIGFFLTKKFKSGVAHDIGKLWMICAIPTMIIGIAFDEFAGMTHLHVLEILGEWFNFEPPHEPLYKGFHRVSHVIELLGITALVGAIHLAIGFIIGAISAIREGHHTHALAKISWLGVEAGLVLIVAAQQGVVSEEFFSTGTVVFGISVVLLFATEKLLGLIEIPGLIGNILSYTRIAAVGIVGVIIAELINEFFVPTPEKGVLALLFLPLFFILHTINAFIAMFEALLQGGRLNLIEFASKFMHGGGSKFKPFGGEKIWQ